LQRLRRLVQAWQAGLSPVKVAAETVLAGQGPTSAGQVGGFTGRWV
jgi:hypothetical protein